MFPKIPQFTGNPASAVYKLRLLRESANRNRNISGDGLINSHIAETGTTQRFSIERLLSRIPHGAAGDEIRRAYCAEDAPAKVVIQCWLDYDASGAAAWVVDHLYAASSFCIGSDGNAYRCTTIHTSTLDDKPITGANYAQKWVIVSKVTVYCDIYAGGYLNTAIPELIIGYPLDVWDNDGTWRAFKMFNGAAVCEVTCEEA